MALLKLVTFRLKVKPLILVAHLALFWKRLNTLRTLISRKLNSRVEALNNPRMRAQFSPLLTSLMDGKLLELRDNRSPKLLNTARRMSITLNVAGNCQVPIKFAGPKAMTKLNPKSLRNVNLNLRLKIAKDAMHLPLTVITRRKRFRTILSTLNLTP